MLITSQQMKIVHALLNVTKLMEFKADLVYSYSQERTTSSKDLTINEANALISYLKKLNPETAAAETMRRKILSMAHKLRWELPSGKVDMTAMNTWCVNKSYLKKPLNSYSYKELPKLVSQFQQVYTSVF